MNGVDKFVAALSVQTGTPCDKFSCVERRRCADEKLACSAFRFYVTDGISSHPFIVFSFPKKARDRPVVGSEAKPTAEIYQLAMAE